MGKNLVDTFYGLYKSSYISESIYISDSYNEVLFESDDSKEIQALKKYFFGIWDVEKYSSYETHLCEIRSVCLADYDLYVRTIPFEEKNHIFYDMQDGFVYEEDAACYLMRKDKRAVTIFFKDIRKVFHIKKERENIDNVLLSQIIKNPLNSETIVSGYCLLHCAACVYKGILIVFPARKGAGKSTLLMSALDENGIYLGNDSLFVGVQNGKVVERKNPHAIRLGKETVKNNPFLSILLDDDKMMNNCKMMYSLPVLNGKYQIVASSLFDLKGISVGEDGQTIDCLIFPSLQLDKDENSFSAITYREGEELIRECYRDRDHNISWYPYFLLDYLEDKEKEAFESVCAMIKNIPCFEMTYNGDFNKAKATLDSILEEMKGMTRKPFEGNTDA